MRTRPRIVVDTNALVSRLLLPASVSRTGRSQGRGHEHSAGCRSYYERTGRCSGAPEIRPLHQSRRPSTILRLLGRLAELVPIVYPVHACRDPRDDKFLEVALNGKAELILTGDADLLALNPWQEIAIFHQRTT